MLNQLKYGFKLSANMRLITLAAIVCLNVFFAIMGEFNLWGQAGKITAVSIAGTALGGLLVVMIIGWTQSFKSVFSSPDGYITLLVPTSGMSILLGRMLPIILFDLVSWTLGIIGVVVQSFILVGYNPMQGSPVTWQAALAGVLLAIIGYTFIMSVLFFFAALEVSFFQNTKLRKLLCFLVGVAIVYVLNLSDFILLTVAPFSRDFVFFFIELHYGLNTGMIILLSLLALKSVLLILATSYMIERKVNL